MLVAIRRPGSVVTHFDHQTRLHPTLDPCVDLDAASAFAGVPLDRLGRVSKTVEHDRVQRSGPTHPGLSLDPHLDLDPTL